MAQVDLLRVVRRIATDTRSVGMDLVEIAPAYDHAENTANNGTASSGGTVPHRQATNTGLETDAADTVPDLSGRYH